MPNEDETRYVSSTGSTIGPARETGNDRIANTFKKEAERIAGTYPVGGVKPWRAPKINYMSQHHIEPAENYGMIFEGGRPTIPEGWDTNSPVNVLGHELPGLALSWMPNGVDPYWGEGIKGFLRRAVHSYMKPVDQRQDMEWQAGNIPEYSTEVRLGSGDERKQNNAELMRGIMDRIGGQESGERPNIVTMALRGPGVIIDGLLTGFQMWDETWKGGVGTATFLAEEAEREGFAPAITAEDVEGAFNAGVERRLSEDGELRDEILQRFPELSMDRMARRSETKSWVDRLFNSLMAGGMNILTTTLWNRYVASAYLFKKLRTEGYASAKETHERARILASKMFFTGSATNALKNEYYRRAEAGEDELMLAYELRDPLMEAAGEIVYDPSGLVALFFSNAKVMGTGRYNSAYDEAVKPVGRIADALEDAGNYSDIANGAEKAGDVFEAAVDGRRAVEAGISEAASKRGLFDLTVDSRRAILGRRAGVVAQYVASRVPDPDEALRIFSALGALSDPKRAKEAFSYLVGAAARHDLSLNVFFSQAGNEFGVIMSKLLQDDGNDIIKMLENLRGMDETKAVDALMDFYNTKTESAVKQIFPSLQDVIDAGGEVSRAEQIIANSHKYAQGKWIQPINQFFANLYMGLSPGYAMRNAMQNTLQTFIDYGTDAFRRGPGGWIENTRLWGRGQVPPGMEVGFGPHRALSGLSDNAKTFRRPLSPVGWDPVNKKLTFRNFMQVSEQMEQRAAATIIGHTIDDIMRRGCREGLAIPDLRFLTEAGIAPKQANYLTQLIMENHGNVDAAVSAWRKSVANGSVSAIGLGEFITDDYWKMIRGMPGGEDYMRQVLKMKDEGASLDEVLDAVEEIFRRRQANASNVALESTAIAADDPVGQIITRAVEDGGLSESAADALRSRYVANSNAVQDYMQSAEKILKSEMNRISSEVASAMGGAAPEAIAEEIAKRQEIIVRFQGEITALSGSHAELVTRFAERSTITKALSDRIHAAPADANFSDMIRKVFNDPDIPVPDGLTRSDAGDFLWNQLYRNKRKIEFERFRDGVSTTIEDMMTRLTEATGEDFTQHALMLQSRITLADARKWDGVTIEDEAWMAIMKQGGFFSEGTYEIQYLAAQMGIPTVGSDGKMIPGAVDEMVRVINANLPEGVEPFHHIQDIGDLKDIPIDVAREAFMRYRGFAGDVVDGTRAVDDLVDEFGDIVTQPVWSRIEDRLPWMNIDPNASGKIQELSASFRGGEISIEEYKEAVIKILQENAPESVEEATRVLDIPFARNTSSLPTPPQGDAVATAARVEHDSLAGTRSILDNIKNEIQRHWDETVPLTGLDDTAEAALKEWASTADRQIGELYTGAVGVANAARDFTLLGYGTDRRNFDLVLAYLYPYHFWHTRTYAHWMQRIATRPNVISAYESYKRAINEAHAGMPDWWRQNINSNDVFGLDWENPLFFNLEATMNPLNGLTGVDFDDPYRRVDNWTETLHALGTWGPSTWTPLNIATATALMMRGEEEAASRWAGRLSSQTATFKALTSMFDLERPEGFFGDNNIVTPAGVEVDPFVLMFSGGIDPYERRRVGRALAILVEEGSFTNEEIIEAAYRNAGPAWDAAMGLAANQRAMGQMSSFLFGVGFKARNQTDMELDNFYTEYFGLWAQEPNLSPDELRTGLENLRRKYPFMDPVLLSRKGSLERDRAFAYSVLGRIAPGQRTEIAEALGLPPEYMDKFYDEKGAIHTWEETEQMQFMAAILDMAIAIEIPTDATIAEWNDASSLYRDMLETAPSMFGDDILELADMYFEMKGDSVEERQEAEAFLALNPQIGDYLDWRAQVVTFDPTLSAYYGGIEQIQNYYKGLMYQEVEQELGVDIRAMWSEYYGLKDAGEDYQSYYDENKEIFEQYYDIRDSWDDRIFSGMASFGSRMDQLIPTAAREDGDRTIGSRRIQEEIEELQEPVGIPVEVWQEVITEYGGEQLWRLVLDEDDLPDVAMSQLEQLAAGLGISVQDILLQLR